MYSKKCTVRRIVCLVFVVCVLGLPGLSRGELTTSYWFDVPPAPEVDRLLDTHPQCGVLILYSTIASKHPDLLSTNLDAARDVAEVFADNEQEYDNLAKTFRVIALHLNEHRELSRFAAIAYWRRACGNMEQCTRDGPRSQACRKADSAVDNFDY